MAIDIQKKLEILNRFAVQWGHLHKMALKARQKTAIISNEEDAEFKRTREKILPIYTNMKSVLGKSVDHSEHAINVLRRTSSLKQILDIPEADKNILFHRFDIVATNIHEFGEELQPGGMGVIHDKSLPTAAVAALEKGPLYSVSEGDIEESRRRSRPRTFGATWSCLMMDPVDFFDYDDHERGITKPVKFTFTLFLMCGLIMLLCSLFLFSNTIITTGMARMLKNLNETYSEILVYLAVWFAIYFVITTVALFLILITSAWSFVCMKIVGGTGRYDSNFAVHCFSYAPHVLTPLFLILPVLIVVSIVYQFILRVLGGAKIHKISYSRSLLGRLLVLVPYLVAVFILTKLNYTDHWNAEVQTNNSIILMSDNNYYNAPAGLKIRVVKHLPDGTAHIKAVTPIGDVEGRILEDNLKYSKVDFFKFVRLEMGHMPVRISQFSSRLNIRIFGKRDTTPRNTGPE